jgi:3',5'-cyclic AMP phosphodiesterase CpdA
VNRALRQLDALATFDEAGPLDLTFALCTDLHFGPEALYKGKLRKLSAHAGRLLGDFVERMNREVDPAFIVNLGDDIEDESPEADLARYGACMDILGRAKADLVHVAGNHDTVHLAAPALLGLWARRADGLPKPSGLHYAFDRAGLHFVVLHTRELKDRNITVGEEQLRWLEADLAQTRLPTIVLMHHSAADQHLVGNRWFEGRANICLVQERKDLRRILEASDKVLAVFNGHLHWNHLDVISGIPYVTVQSLIENLDEDAPGRPACAHAVVRVSRSRVVVEVAGAEPARYQFDR